ncbi:hypothetical protein DFJ73DRAFT_801164 [Zopfochytrium polystomum]|nr:hypothetical protein DFJ73DRAFT_801164 [Zopfochytrium polystomum]
MSCRIEEESSNSLPIEMCRHASCSTIAAALRSSAASSISPKQCLSHTTVSSDPLDIAMFIACTALRGSPRTSVVNKNAVLTLSLIMGTSSSLITVQVLFP